MKFSFSKDVFLPAHHTRGGVRVAHEKHTAGCPTQELPVPACVTIPMQQHIGAPCIPCVKKGDWVAVGQIIGDSDSFVSAPIHASVSGTVRDITELLLPSGQRTQAVVIESDGQMTPLDGLEPPKVQNQEQLAAAARSCGMVGLGGAGFPMHVKLMPPKGKKVDTLVINVAECEPYLTADLRECLENPTLIMETIYQIFDWMTEVEQVIIAVENNKPEAIEILGKIAADSRDVHNQVRLMRLRTRYPQGAEKIIVQAATGRRVPMGKLPADVGCVVMNITSVAQLGRYLRTGMPLTRKRVTVDGPAVRSAKNVLAPIGTPIHELISFCGGYAAEPTKLLMGGPMMGLCLLDDSFPILKQTNGILVFDQKEDLSAFSEQACIRCGRCAAVCPMSLMPTRIERFARVGDVQTLRKIGVTVCMECGSCAYSCPAHRPLVQYMRMAKSIERKAAVKE